MEKKLKTMEKRQPKKWVEPEKWVVINRHEINTLNEDAVRIFGSIRGIAKANLLVDGQPLTYDMLRNRISETRHWVSDKWVIKECKIIRGKRKTSKK